MNQQEITTNNVHGWLMDVPGYRENYSNEGRHLLDIHEADETSHKQRPCSLLSISSEDSISLEELINANFTTDMKDETDLSALSTLDLDDSTEDFWKMDNFLNHLIIPHQFSPPMDKLRMLHNSSNGSNYQDDLFHSKNSSLDDLLDDSLDDSFFSTHQVTEHDFMTSLKLSGSYGEFDNPRLLQVPTSLPVSPKSLSSSPIHRQRMNRSGSISSENSINSASTITPYRHIYPSASTSTSSIGSHSTVSSFLPRTSSHHTENTATRLSQPRFRAKPPTSLSEKTTTTLPSRSISNIGLTRRATHIPAPATSPSSNKKSILLSPPHRTQSTTLVHKKSNTSLTSSGGRSASRIGQPSRASHIPTPPARSTTSLGLATSIFSSTTKPQERPKTSMGSTLKSNSLRRPSSTMIPNPTKSTGLRMPTPLYK